jgi:hypothetical protein
VASERAKGHRRAAVLPVRSFQGQRAPLAESFASAPSRWSEPDSSDEVVYLAVTFSVNHPPRLSLGSPSCSTREPSSLIPVLDGLKVAEVPRESIELRSGRAHDGTSSLVARSARMTRSTMARFARDRRSTPSR